MTVIDTTGLPEGFEARAPYSETWGKLETQDDRYLLRQHSSMEELKAYYDAAAPRLNEIFDHLDKFPMDKLPKPEAIALSHRTSAHRGGDGDRGVSTSAAFLRAVSSQDGDRMDRV